jgi:hypothetical protein
VTFLEFCTDAFRMTGIVGQSETPDAAQGAKAVTRFNDVMASLAEDGIDLGYSPIFSTSATITLPLGAVLGLKSMLCVALCPDYGVDIPAVPAGDAQRCYERLLRQAVMLQNTPTELRSVSNGDGSRYRWNIETG